MSFTETRLVNPQQLTTSASTALYTVPGGKSAIIKQIVITNTTSTPATFTFYINGSTVDKALFSNTSVPGNDSLVINLSQVLNPSDTINALASAGTTLNITVSGVLNDGPLNPASLYIADNAITAPKILDGSITSTKLNSTAGSEAVITGAIRNSAVTSEKIADLTIVNGDISASAAIAQSKIANLTSDIAAKANTASPTFTGTVVIPTANVTNYQKSGVAGTIVRTASVSVTFTTSNSTQLINMPSGCTIFNLISCFPVTGVNNTVTVTSIRYGDWSGVQSSNQIAITGFLGNGVHLEAFAVKFVWEA
jgi:hypothetical protein